MHLKVGEAGQQKNRDRAHGCSSPAAAIEPMALTSTGSGEGVGVQPPTMAQLRLRGEEAASASEHLSSCPDWLWSNLAAAAAETHLRPFSYSRAAPVATGILVAVRQAHEPSHPPHPTTTVGVPPD